MPLNPIGAAIDAAMPFVSDWPEPEMGIISEGRRAPPRLPIEVFGPWQSWVEDTAEGAGPVPPDYVGTALLAVAAALTGNARWVSPWPSWREPPVLWVGAIGSPSAGKSPAMRPLLQIVRRLESEMAEGFEETRRRWLTDREAAECTRAAWEADVKQATKAGSPAPMIPANATEPPEPTRPRLVVTDTTPEALAAILAGQPRGLLMLRDELAGWIASFDRYSGGGAERALWLECNGGGSFTLDRVKHGGKPLRIPHLTIGVLGGIQPDRLATLLFSGDDDGLASRMLVTWPEPMAPARPTRSADDEEAARALRRLMSLAMATGEDGNPVPQTVPLTGEAADLFVEWRRENHAATEAAAGRLAGHMGKLPGIVLRLALVLEHLWWAWGRTEAQPANVSLQAVAAAAGLVTDYFVPMAERAYGDAALPETDRLAATLARWIVKARPTTVGVKDLYRRIRLPGLTRAEPVRLACQRLVDADWLAEDFTRDGETPGRRKGTYRVNPRIYGDAP